MDPLRQDKEDNLKHPQLIMLLQDFDQFENTFLPPYSVYPMNNNDSIDLDNLEEILIADTIVEEMTVEEGPIFIGDKDGGGSSGGEVGEQQAVGSDSSAQPQVGENVKNWVTRKRYKKGSAEAICRMEENKIKNRIAAAQAIEKKQAYVRKLQSQIQRLRKENALKKKLLLILEGNLRMGETRKQLQRTISGPI